MLKELGQTSSLLVSIHGRYVKAPDLTLVTHKPESPQDNSGSRCGKISNSILHFAIGRLSIDAFRRFDLAFFGHWFMALFKSSVVEDRHELPTVVTIPRPTRLRDREVRAAIHEHLVPTLIGQSPSRVVDEFSLCNGESRIDVAIINGRLHGVEIKSEADTLHRLERQIETYGRVFDTVTIVCGRNHLSVVKSRVPEWWGIYCVALDEAKTVRLNQVRPNSLNKTVDAFSLAQFLWKREIITLLETAGCSRAVLRQPSRHLWRVLANAYSIDALKTAVRDVLRDRSDWRPEPLQM